MRRKREGPTRDKNEWRGILRPRRVPRTTATDIYGSNQLQGNTDILESPAGQAIAEDSEAIQGARDTRRGSGRPYDAPRTRRHFRRIIGRRRDTIPAPPRGPIPQAFSTVPVGFDGDWTIGDSKEREEKEHKSGYETENDLLDLQIPEWNADNYLNIDLPGAFSPPPGPLPPPRIPPYAGPPVLRPRAAAMANYPNPVQYRDQTLAPFPGGHYAAGTRFGKGPNEKYSDMKQRWREYKINAKAAAKPWRLSYQEMQEMFPNKFYIDNEGNRKMKRKRISRMYYGHRRRRTFRRRGMRRGFKRRRGMGDYASGMTQKSLGYGYAGYNPPKLWWQQ